MEPRIIGLRIEAGSERPRNESQDREGQEYMESDDSIGMDNASDAEDES